MRKESAMGQDGGSGEVPLVANLDEALIAMHEYHRGLRKAGFGRMEALWLTGAWAKGVPMPDWLYDLLESHRPYDESGGA